MLNLFIFVLVMTTATVYFIPTMVALSRRHPQVMGVFLANLYLGFTFIGWVISLIWSFSDGSAQTSSATEVREKTYNPSSGGMVKFLKYAGAAAGFLIVLVLALFLLAGTGSKTTAQGPVGVPMSADDMFKATQPAAPAAK